MNILSRPIRTFFYLTFIAVFLPLWQINLSILINPYQLFGLIFLFLFIFKSIYEKSDFNIKAEEICSSSGNYNVLQKNIEVLDLDETPAYGLETKLKIGINGFIECK